MFKLMIVDDEIVIREGLKKNIPWEELEVEIICEAGDGIEAINMIEEFKPNIVLMDIDLPYKNGLDVAQEIITSHNDVIIIIITGHNDFEYAQKALKIGAFDLILKPMDSSSIRDTIKKACTALNTINSEKLKSENIRRILKDSMPLLREKYIISILNTGIPVTEEQIKEKLSGLGIDIENEFYNTAVIIPGMPNNSGVEEELLWVAKKEFVEENLLKNDLKAFLYYDTLYRLVILFSYSGRDRNETVENVFMGIRDKLRFIFHTDAFIGIGKESTSFTNLEASYRSACDALNYVNLYGRNNVVNIRNVNEIELNKSTYTGKDIDSIVISFKTANYTEFNDKLNTLFNNIITTSSGSMDPVKRMCVELMAAVLRACDDQKVRFEYLFEAEGSYLRILGFNNIIDLKEWILRICKELIIISVEKRNWKVNRIVELAKNYIQENYRNEQLSLKNVCEHVGLSNTYFCQLFYKETEIYFSEYINIVRVEAAKKLLEDSVLKIYEIAYEVGYNNPKYINMIFKKITGMTPVEYRNSINKRL